MKLVIAGATGFVATELIRQSLSIPKITSVIAIARHSVSTPSNLSPTADPSKLRSVIIENYGSYPEDVMKQLAGADACIWYVPLSPPSISPYRSRPPLEPAKTDPKKQPKTLNANKLKPKRPGPSQSHPGNRAVSPSTKSAASATTTPSQASTRSSKRTAQKAAAGPPRLSASCT